MKPISPLASAPPPFSAIAEKVNEIIASRPPLVAGAGIRIVESSQRTIIAADIAAITSTVSDELLRSRTFFAYAGTGTDINVTAGVLNNVFYAGGTLSSASDGDLVYIEATVTTDTDTVTAVTVAKAASVPADTSTKAYTVIGSVAVSGGVATVTPLAWNYSQLQKCGSFRWGGFGA